MKANEMINNYYTGKRVNQKLVKYGKINKNIAYELTHDNGEYLSSLDYNIIFVEKDNDDKLNSRTDLNKHMMTKEQALNYIDELKTNR